MFLSASVLAFAASLFCTTPQSSSLPITVLQPAAPVAAAALVVPQLPVDLGLAGNFAVLAKAGISTTGTTLILGDIGVSPISSIGLTGFGLTMAATNRHSTSSLVRGRVYAPDYAPPTPAYLSTAVSNMEAAYTDAAGRSLPDHTELGAGDVGGMTLSPGLYAWGTDVSIPSNGVTLAGNSTDVWIFQISGDLIVASGAIVTLSGGAKPSNVFWQVAGQATLGTTAAFQGILLCQTQVVMNNGATLNGRALAQTAVTLIANSIVQPRHRRFYHP